MPTAGIVIHSGVKLPTCKQRTDSQEGWLKLELASRSPGLGEGAGVGGC